MMDDVKEGLRMTMCGRATKLQASEGMWQCCGQVREMSQSSIFA